MTPYSKKILLGIDLEECDIPVEYGHSMQTEEKMYTTRQGMDVLEPLLAKHQVITTFFTTAFWAKKETFRLRQLAVHNEIASHSFFHDQFATEDLARSRNVLSDISGQDVIGFRMPRMRSVSMKDIANAGYLYDSSLHPTWVPGRYNHLLKPKTAYREMGIWELPISVSPALRISVFWLSFKNLPLSYYLFLCRRILQLHGYLILYFHPWEFADLDHFSLPGYIKRLSGSRMLDKTDKLLSALSKMGDFSTHGNLVKSFLAHEKEN